MESKYWYSNEMRAVIFVCAVVALILSLYYSIWKSDATSGAIAGVISIVLLVLGCMKRLEGLPDNNNPSRVVTDF